MRYIIIFLPQFTILCQLMHDATALKKKQLQSSMQAWKDKIKLYSSIQYSELKASYNKVDSGGIFLRLQVTIPGVILKRITTLQLLLLLRLTSFQE